MSQITKEFDVDPTFSFHLTVDKDDPDDEESANQSFLEFGRPDVTQMASGNDSDIVWVPQLDKDKETWSNEIRGIKIDVGEDAAPITFATTPMTASTYTSGQCILGPTKYINFLRNSLKDALSYHEV